VAGSGHRRAGAGQCARHAGAFRARTAWHTHPAGQTLYILSGLGRVQSAGGPVREVRAGDVISFSPGEKHWHGAGPATTMSHMAITEISDGKYVAWMEKVANEQYNALPG
jgi:quercetin dioxygenase-like cupin family protein